MSATAERTIPEQLTVDSSTVIEAVAHMYAVGSVIRDFSYNDWVGQWIERAAEKLEREAFSIEQPREDDDPQKVAVSVRADELAAELLQLLDVRIRESECRYRTNAQLVRVTGTT